MKSKYLLISLLLVAPFLFFSAKDVYAQNTCIGWTKCRPYDVDSGICSCSGFYTKPCVPGPGSCNEFPCLGEDGVCTCFGGDSCDYVPPPGGGTPTPTPNCGVWVNENCAASGGGLNCACDEMLQHRQNCTSIHRCNPDTSCLGPWVNENCGASGGGLNCACDQMLQHRQNCTGIHRCNLNASCICTTPTPTPTLPPVPICTIQGRKVLMPGNQQVEPAISQTVFLNDPSWSSTANPYSRSFNYEGKTRTVSVSIPTGYSVGYTLCYNDTTCHGNTPQQGSSVNLSDNNYCSSLPSGFADLWWHYTLSVNPWWQVVDADVFSAGDLESQVPVGNRMFDVDGPGEYPGVPFYGGTNTNLTSNNVSSKHWLAQTGYFGERYNYEFFLNKVQTEYEEYFTDIGASFNGNFNAGCNWPLNSNYYWYKATASTRITGNVSVPVGRKVILLVDNPDTDGGENITFQGNVNITEGNSLFMVIASGNIILDSGVTTLEGIYITDGTFNTGDFNTQLNVLGSVVAWEGVNLQRKYTTGNNPAEIFTYSPAQIFQIPAVLNRRRIMWKEVVP